MGHLQASEMATYAPDLTIALTWHLRSNHFPPVPLSMVPICEAAIDAANADEYDQRIDLPDGVSYRGDDTAPAWAVIEAYHLDDFLAE
jgi:hypothetical protein